MRVDVSEIDSNVKAEVTKSRATVTRLATLRKLNSKGERGSRDERMIKIKNKEPEEKKDQVTSVSQKGEKRNDKFVKTVNPREHRCTVIKLRKRR